MSSRLSFASRNFRSRLVPPYPSSVPPTTMPAQYPTPHSSCYRTLHREERGGTYCLGALLLAPGVGPYACSVPDIP
eukprot:1964874-Rhodomonas_salina.2